jgi:DNA uptake protein ComE-like DNA-binding protein
MPNSPQVPKWWARKWLRIPVFAWIVVGTLILTALSSTPDSERADQSDSTSQVAESTTTLPQTTSPDLTSTSTNPPASTSTSTSTSTTIVPASSATATAPATSRSGTSVAPPTSLLAALAALQVESEPPRTGYSRDLFPHWADTNGSGCNARQDTLRSQVIGLPQVDLFSRCVIVEGDWYSLFDAVNYSGSPAELDVDHVVALSEAWDSGASRWTTAQRRAFANDQLNLLAVTASSNRSKGDRDAGEWLPPSQSAWCVTGAIIITVKAKYRLSIDAREKAGLERLVGTCGQPDQLGVPGLSTDIVSALTGGAVATPRTETSTSPPTTQRSTTTTIPASTTAPATTSVPPNTSVPRTACVNINTATYESLLQIVHIGPERAEQLISLRPFRSVDDMTRINGIGPARVADIKAQGLACT